MSLYNVSEDVRNVKWTDDLARRNEMASYLDYYNNDEDSYVSDHLDYLYPETSYKLKKYMDKYPLTEMITNDKSIAFSTIPNIEIKGNDSLTNKLKNLLIESKLWGTMQSVDSMVNLVGKTGVMPSFRDGKIKLDIITPDTCFVTQSAYDPTVITELYYEVSPRFDSPTKADSVQTYVMWTPTYFQYVSVDHSNGSMNPLTEIVEHSYGRIPITWFSLEYSTNSFWSKKKNSTIASHRNIVSDLTNIAYTVAYQAFSTLVTRGLDRSLPINFGVSNYLNLPPDVSSASDHQADASYITPNPKLEQMWIMVNDKMASAAKSAGLSGDSYRKDSKTYSSGYELKLSMIKLLRQTTINRSKYLPAIIDLISLIAQTYNTHVSNTYSTDSMVLDVEFNKFEIDYSEKEVLENRLLEI